VDDSGKTSLAGRTLAHYRISTAIGAGGMGEVYRAKDTKLGRDCHAVAGCAPVVSNRDFRQLHYHRTVRGRMPDRAGSCLLAPAKFRRQFYIMLAWSVLAAFFLIVAALRWPAGVLLSPAVAVHGTIALLLWTKHLREGTG